MALTRRDFVKTGTAGAALGLAGSTSPLLSGAARADWSGGGVRSHGESLLGALKYGPDFKHFDYVNPDAPKGGTARISAAGLFDTFNPLNGKGRPTLQVQTIVYEQLMAPSLDEGSTHYGLLAEWMEIAPDGTWGAFRLRDEAVWHDGRPITVADVQNSLELLITKGEPLYRFYYADVEKVVDEGDRVVRFMLKSAENKELAHILGQLYVMPAHWWAERAFDEPKLEPPLGSGPYRIGRFDEGKFVEYERVKDYWGADLPVRRGQYNFDILRFEYFLDRDTAFEAFKKGEVDYWRENSASRWAERFNFPAIESGKVVKKTVELEGPQAVQGYIPNLRREKFADRRLREAFALAYDFEWTNRAVYFDQYARASSYFQNSEGLTATGLPDAAELALLEPFRDQLPPEVFEKPFEQPTTNGSGRNRSNLRRAQKILADAGYERKSGKLIDPTTGAPFELEYLARQGGGGGRDVKPFLQNLEKLGVTATFREVDTPQYISRVRSYDFDMVGLGMINSESPGNEQREYWGSTAADSEGGRNYAGVKNEAIDALIETIITAKDRASLEAASRAVDRILIWERYWILTIFSPNERYAYWDKFGAPDPLPPRAVGFANVWWWDEVKASKI